MRRTFAFLIAVLFSSPLQAERVEAQCVSAGCVITLLQRAQFIENKETCEWEYIPGKSSGGRTLIRGRQQKFIVLSVVARDGEEFVIAYQHVIFDLKDSVVTVSFPMSYLQNKKAFSISYKTPA